MRRKGGRKQKKHAGIKEFLPSDKMLRVFCHNKQAEKVQEVDDLLYEL